MSLPGALGVSLKRFNAAAVTAIRILPDKLSAAYAAGESAVFELPSSGMLDLSSLSLLGSVTVTGTGTIVTPPVHDLMIRRVSCQIGGYTVSLAGCGDYGFCAWMKALYSGNKTVTDFKQSSLKQGSVTLTSGTASDVTLLSSFMGFLGGDKGVRFIPLDLFPKITITVDFHSATRFATATTVTAATISNLRLLAQRYDVADNLVSQLWADRISKNGSVEMPFSNVFYMEAPTVASSGSASYTNWINSQSVDLILFTNRPSGYATAVTADQYSANNGGSGSTIQGSFNSVPLSNWYLNVDDAMWATMSALDGNGDGSMFAPDVATAADFRDTYFALIYKMAVPAEAAEARGAVFGTPTYGQAVPIDYNLQGGSATSRKPVIVVFTTGVLSLSGGKQVVPLN